MGQTDTGLRGQRQSCKGGRGGVDDRIAGGISEQE